MLLDVWMPNMNGLDVLAALPKEGARPKVVVLTADDTPETLLKVVREQAWRYVAKPVEPEALVELLHEVLSQTAVARAIEVVSARPDWVELLVPCQRAEVDRIESFMSHLEADLPADVRESVGYAFRELLMNAIEWGGGLDPSRTVRGSLSSRHNGCCSIASPILVPASTWRGCCTPPSASRKTIRWRTRSCARKKGCDLVDSGF
jgi:response regulator receiver domain-containing protein